MNSEEVNDITTVVDEVAVTTITEITTLSEDTTATTSSVEYDDIYNAVQSCNATLTVMLAILLVCIGFFIASKIFDFLGINDC